MTTSLTHAPTAPRPGTSTSTRPADLTLEQRMTLSHAAMNVALADTSAYMTDALDRAGVAAAVTTAHIDIEPFDLPDVVVPLPPRRAPADNARHTGRRPAATG